MEKFSTPGIESATEQISEKIKQRLEQSNASRLAEYITGINLEDPTIVDRMIEDQKRIRGKYGLPDRRTIFFDPAEHERFLRSLAHKLNVEIREKSHCGKLIDNADGAEAVYFEETKNIGIDIDKTDLRSYIHSLNVLEHEMIHAMQFSNPTTSMPVELQEYEAYIGMGNMDALKNNPDMAEVVFEHLIGGSVQWWYSLLAKEKGIKEDPVWSKPDYFLKKDGMSDEEVASLMETYNKEDLKAA
jgi:hypothetical protein